MWRIQYWSDTGRDNKREETTGRRFGGDGFMRPLGCARSSKVLASIRMTCARIREPVVNERRLLKEPLVRRTPELGVA